MLGACGSHQHRPDPDLLISSDNCEIVNGRYIVGQESESDILASAIFGSEETIDNLEIRKSDQGVVFLGFLEAKQVLKREIPRRFSCKMSVLTVVLDDQGSGGALVMSASDTRLELFSTNESTLALRFIDSALTFVFIVPAYQSEDYEVILERVTGPNAN
jgi:hypothetical protein